MANTFISESRVFVEKLFDNAVEAMHELRPDLVVHAGGVVGEGTQADYEPAVDKLSTLDLPLLITPSGRDMNYLGYELFVRYFGDIDPSYETDQLYIQGVSSFQYDAATGVVGKSAREKLWSVLGDVRAKARAVFLHHNVIPVPHSRNKGLLEDAGDFLRELARKSLRRPRTDPAVSLPDGVGRP
jgi:hypothetical protein